MGDLTRDRTTDESLANAFSALGDERRLRALRYIAGAGPGRDCEDDTVCACHVQEHLGLSQPATSYHLKVLREAGLVSAEKRGRWVHYRLSGPGLSALRSFLGRMKEAASGAVGAAT